MYSVISLTCLLTFTTFCQFLDSIDSHGANGQIKKVIQRYTVFDGLTTHFKTRQHYTGQPGKSAECVLAVTKMIVTSPHRLPLPAQFQSLKPGISCSAGCQAHWWVLPPPHCHIKATCHSASRIRSPSPHEASRCLSTHFSFYSDHSFGV